MAEQLNKKEKDVLTPSDISQIIGISMKSVYRLIKSGQFKYMKIGTDYRIPKGGFYRWLNS